jgi:hypothetical protein
MSTRKPNSPHRVFQFLYLSVIFLVLAVTICPGTIGLIQTGAVEGAVLGGYLSFVYFGTPLLVIFLALNIWGFVKDTPRRRRYGIVILPLSIWIAYLIVRSISDPAFVSLP